MTNQNITENEKKIYELWRSKNAFASAVDSDGKVLDEKRAQTKPFTIVLPPPNITGRLHMGHALSYTFQDMLIRYKRMQSIDALWVPGTDHAGISTQTIVKKMLDADGIDYREMGREKFVERVWQWKEKYGSIILGQMEKMGYSLDWNRLSFTMDERLSKAVRKFFKDLYDQGLIYRGKRIVNWCPVDRTALSDAEVQTKEGGEKGFLWHINYPLADGSGHLTVATTRPETLFGDVAVAVNPGDERFNSYIGKEVIVPLQERKIPVIADEYVDMEFGTGCLKITPAHDPNDFEIGQKHGLEQINVMNEDASMNEIVPERYRGLDRYKCREKAIEELKEKELLVLEEERMTPIGRAERSKAPIEYRLSSQWFVKMQPLADKVLSLHKELDFKPERWEKVYLGWIENIRDWCISRQLWWGHRIPAWHHKESGEIKVSETTPQAVLDNPNDWYQDEDVLDTWFSSALWPMSTLGWPEKTKDFDRYFPTSTLVTGKDIIFFWVARMNFAATYFTGKMPYNTVFFNPIILDERGETMSKSKGNGIDPLTVVDGASLEDLKRPVHEALPSNAKEILKRIEKNFPNGFEGVGADAMRYTLIYICSGGQQLRLSLNSFHDLGRRFLTKLNNAARFLMMYIEQEKDKGGELPQNFSEHFTDEDVWIQAKLAETTRKLCAMYEGHDFTNLGETYYHFVWNDFCDWYIELCKVRLTSDDATQRKTALHSLTTTFAGILRILHPMIPFVTEDLWQKLVPLADSENLWGNQKPKSDLLMLDHFPENRELNSEEETILNRFQILQSFVGNIRTLRKTYQIKDGEKLSATALTLSEDAKAILDSGNATIKRLANLSDLNLVAEKSQKPEKTVTVLNPHYEIYLNIADFINVEKEEARLNKEMEKLEKEINGLEKRLANEKFVSNAAPEVVDEQKEKLGLAKDKLEKTKSLSSDLKSW